jgi:hypothetical protein
MRNSFAAFVLICLSPAASAQPFSTSMAECSALYQNAAQWVETDVKSERLMGAMRAWYQASVAQATTEGVRNAAPVMMEMIDEKTGFWEAKGARFFLSEEFRDWTAYCRSFARAQGIETGL